MQHCPDFFFFFSFNLVIFFVFLRKVKETDGVSRLVALTREAPLEEKDQHPLRSYSNAVITDANRVRNVMKSMQLNFCYGSFQQQKEKDGIRYWTYNGLFQKLTVLFMWRMSFFQNLNLLDIQVN